MIHHSCQMIDIFEPNSVERINGFILRGYLTAHSICLCCDCFYYFFFLCQIIMILSCVVKFSLYVVDVFVLHVCNVIWIECGAWCKFLVFSFLLHFLCYTQLWFHRCLQVMLNIIPHNQANVTSSNTFFDNIVSHIFTKQNLYNAQF